MSNLCKFLLPTYSIIITEYLNVNMLWNDEGPSRLYKEKYIKVSCIENNGICTRRNQLGKDGGEMKSRVHVTLKTLTCIKHSLYSYNTYTTRIFFFFTGIPIKIWKKSIQSNCMQRVQIRWVDGCHYLCPPPTPCWPEVIQRANWMQWGGGGRQFY